MIYLKLTAVFIRVPATDRVRERTQHTVLACYAFKARRKNVELPQSHNLISQSSWKENKCFFLSLTISHLFFFNTHLSYLVKPRITIPESYHNTWHTPTIPAAEQRPWNAIIGKDLINQRLATEMWALLTIFLWGWDESQKLISWRKKWHRRETKLGRSISIIMAHKWHWVAAEWFDH